MWSNSPWKQIGYLSGRQGGQTITTAPVPLGGSIEERWGVCVCVWFRDPPWGVSGLNWVLDTPGLGSNTGVWSLNKFENQWGLQVSVQVAQSCLTLRSHGLYSPWNSPGQNTGVGSLSFLQGIFPTQGLKPGLPHCRRILYQLSYHKLSHKGTPRILEWVAYPFSRGSSQPRNRTRVSCIAGEFFTNWATIFPAVSVNKDVTIISDFSLPNVKFWTVRAPRKERNTYPPGDIRLQPLPTVSTEELGCEKTQDTGPR